jgi:hypothetical protein
VGRGWGGEGLGGVGGVGVGGGVGDGVGWGGVGCGGVWGVWNTSYTSCVFVHPPSWRSNKNAKLTFRLRLPP